MTRMLRRVVKLGGSLLDWSDWRWRFEAWLADQPPAENFLLPGGGALADAVREINALYPISEVAAHWLCIRAMSVHAAQLAARWPSARICRSLRELDGMPAAVGLVIVDPWPILQDEEPHYPGQPLPASWDVTSDSIAARIAEIIAADELVLLKSAPAAASESLAELSQRGYVDAFFPQAAEPFKRIRYVNLR